MCLCFAIVCAIWLKFCFFLKRLRVRVRKSPNKVNLVVIYGRLVTSSMLYPCRWKHWKAEWTERSRTKQVWFLWRLIKSSKVIITHYYQLDWDCSNLQRSSITGDYHPLKIIALEVKRTSSGIWVTRSPECKCCQISQNNLLKWYYSFLISLAQKQFCIQFLMLLGCFHKMQFKRVVTHQEVGESYLLPVEFLIQFCSFLFFSPSINDFKSSNYVLLCLGETRVLGNAGSQAQKLIS